jgi:hypothetical protein
MSPALSRIEAPEQAANRQSDSLAALAITLFLVVIGLYLIDRLRAQGEYQDCVLSGHQGCEVSTSF